MPGQKPGLRANLVSSFSCGCSTAPNKLSSQESSSILQNRFPESRSRNSKGCVHLGLGQRLNKQKNHSFCGSGTDGFSHLNYRRIACYYCEVYENSPLLHFFLAASNAYGATYAKNAHFCFGRLGRFLLVGKHPKPFESQVPCELRT